MGANLSFQWLPLTQNASRQIGTSHRHRQVRLFRPRPHWEM